MRLWHELSLYLHLWTFPGLHSVFFIVIIVTVVVVVNFTVLILILILIAIPITGEDISFIAVYVKSRLGIN